VKELRQAEDNPDRPPAKEIPIRHHLRRSPSSETVMATATLIALIAVFVLEVAPLAR
jgi:hypothetical protein